MAQRTNKDRQYAHALANEKAYRRAMWARKRDRWGHWLLSMPQSDHKAVEEYFRDKLRGGKVIIDTADY